MGAHPHPQRLLQLEMELEITIIGELIPLRCLEKLPQTRKFFETSSLEVFCNSVFAGFHESKKRKNQLQENVNEITDTEVIPEPMSPKIPQPNSTQERCAHCNTTNHPTHRCWVLKKDLKCYKCGGANHIAVTCQNLPKGGMQFQIQKDTDINYIDDEIAKLQKLRDIVMRKKQKLQRGQFQSNNARQSFLSQSSRLH